MCQKMIVALLFMTLMSECLGANVQLLKPYDDFAVHMYQTSDTNHDGLLSVEEVKEEFQQYDVNHDGHISRHEYTAYICFLQPVLYQLSHYLFDQYDLNPQDHILELSDFQAFYAKLDGNGDGKLTQSEWVTWWVKTFQGLETAGYHPHGHSAEHGSHHCM